MNPKYEIDYAKMNGKKGTLIVADNGIYFQPYDMSKQPPYLMGDAASISETGIFGAFNLQKKLSNTKSLHEIAHETREKKGLEELVKSKEIRHIPWEDIASSRKFFLSGNNILRTKQGHKIKLRITEIEKEKEITSFMSSKIRGLAA